MDSAMGSEKKWWVFGCGVYIYIYSGICIEIHKKKGKANVASVNFEPR